MDRNNNKRPTDPSGVPPEMTAFTSSLKKSLEKNRILQKTLLQALGSLGQEMADNRRLASRLTRGLYEDTPTPRIFPKAQLPVVKSLLERMAEGTDESTETCEEEFREKAQQQAAKLTAKKVQKYWTADPYAPWKRPYFVDPLGSTPKPNQDTLKRKRIAEAHEDEEHFFAHLSQPWSQGERKLLQGFINQQAADSNDSIDYEAAAKHVTAKRTFKEVLPTLQPRTAEECKIQHQRQLADQQPKLSKAEIQKVVQLVDQQMETSTIDWNAVAQSIGNSRSPWHCFVAYQKVQNSAPHQPNWTPTQDELLLKYICAQGPQFVLDTTNIDDMCIQLFPDKTRRNVLLRTGQSLVNPNLQSTPWSLTEERQLVLCQKIYSDGAAMSVPVHFPIRSARSVREKWSRNLDPAYNKHRPFSVEEDQLLKRVVQEKLEQANAAQDFESKNQCGSAISWAEIRKEHFPDRRSEQLRARWTQELATQEEMLNKIKTDLATLQGIKGGGGEQQPLEDYVVQVVNKKKKPKKR